MDIFPIWRTVYWESEEDSVRFRIVSAGETACEGTASKYPDDDTLKVNLNKPCQAYLDSVIDFSATGDTTSNAYREFALQVKSNNQWITTYEFAFTNDWSYVDHAGDGYSEPINGHSSAGQILVYSVLNETTAETICYDEYDNNPYFSLYPSSINFGYNTETTSVTITTNSSWNVVSVTSGFHVDIISGGSGTTIINVTADSNQLAEQRNGEVLFRVRNEFGAIDASLPITQDAAPAYLNVTGGNGIALGGHSTTWTVTYETNVSTVYYKFMRHDNTVLSTGITTGNYISVNVPESHNAYTYYIEFYKDSSLAQYSWLNEAYAYQPVVPVEIYVTPQTILAYYGGTTCVYVYSTYDWTAVAPSDIRMFRTTGSSGETLVCFSFDNVDEDTVSTITFTATDGETTATDSLVLDRRSHDYSSDYLTLEIVSGDTVVIYSRSVVTGSTALSYSLNNGSTWQQKWFVEPYNGSNVNSLVIDNLHQGSKILLKANRTSSSVRLYVTTVGNAAFNLKGNILSLKYGDNFAGKTTLGSNSADVFRQFFAGSSVINAKNMVIPAADADRCCAELFAGCTSLVTPPVLSGTEVGSGGYLGMFDSCSSLATAPVLPATTLASECYRDMFRRCTSLVTPPELPATTLANYCYARMFAGCTSLTTAPELPATRMYAYCYAYMFDNTPLTTATELPATTLAEGCYLYMFANCSSLTTAPALPAMNLADSCYDEMFRYCTSLTTPPELPATTLAVRCYSGMFRGCSSLTTAPALPAMNLDRSCYRAMFAGCTYLYNAPGLPATTLAASCYADMFMNCILLSRAPVLPADTMKTQCYFNMFWGCTSLYYVKCLATTNISTDNTKYWLDGVSYNGTFEKPNSATWTIGQSGIPSRWTIVNL